MNLAALSTRFWSTSSRRARSPHTGGRSSAISTFTWRSRSRPPTRLTASCASGASATACGGWITRPTRDSSSSSFSSRCILSTASAIRPEVGADALEVAGGRVLLDEAEEAPDRDQRALEVVRDGVGEALELGVLGLELADQRLALGLGVLALGDVLHRAVDADELLLRRVPHRVPVDAHPAQLAALGEGPDLGDHVAVLVQRLHVARVLLQVVGMQRREPARRGPRTPRRRSR